mmetsp:Transcript_3130/g.12545  ORF Transcript_3130/g.12545 Transcript_3130/m.12545 type:complete len:299 (+) Transcript_3130:803-1699(+)
MSSCSISYVNTRARRGLVFRVEGGGRFLRRSLRKELSTETSSRARSANDDAVSFCFAKKTRSSSETASFASSSSSFSPYDFLVARSPPLLIRRPRASGSKGDIGTSTRRRRATWRVTSSAVRPKADAFLARSRRTTTKTSRPEPNASRRETCARACHGPSARLVKGNDSSSKSPSSSSERAPDVKPSCAARGRPRRPVARASSPNAKTGVLGERAVSGDILVPTGEPLTRAATGGRSPRALRADSTRASPRWMGKTRRAPRAPRARASGTTTAFDASETVRRNSSTRVSANELSTNFS